MATPTTSVDEADEFRTQWIQKFQEQALLQAGQPQASAWEGFLAYRELNESKNLWLVLPNAETDDWPFRSLTDKLSREIRFYGLFRQSVVATNQSFQDGLAALLAAETKLRNAGIQESRVKPDVDEQLRKCISSLENARHLLERRRDSYWESVLLAEPEERMRWSVYFDDQGEVHSIPPKEVAEWEEIFEKASYPRNMVKQIDLDARFQVRVAVILRSYLVQDLGISLRTISRLTVLAYICGGFCKEEDENIVLDMGGQQRTLAVGCWPDLAFHTSPCPSTSCQFNFAEIQSGKR